MAKLRNHHFVSTHQTAEMSKTGSKRDKSAKVEKVDTVNAEEEKDETCEVALDTFASLGVVDSLCKAIAGVGWTAPTEIQRNSIPEALKGRDVIGLAETGSGKTGAFAIPILQALLSAPQRLFAVVLAPTRELAFQINEVFEALGASIALNSVCIVGGIDMVTQAIALAKKPHVIVATPGRLVDHLQNTKGFNLRNLKYLVMDEADRMLSMDFEEEINKILAVIPRERRTCLFSATMTSKVAKLQKASLIDPVKVEVSNKFQTPKVLLFLLIVKCHGVFIKFALTSFSITAIGATVSVHPRQVQRLLFGVSPRRVQGPVGDYLRRHVQQCPPCDIAIAQSGIRSGVSPRPALPGQAPRRPQ